MVVLNYFLLLIFGTYKTAFLVRSFDTLQYNLFFCINRQSKTLTDLTLYARVLFDIRPIMYHVNYKYFNYIISVSYSIYTFSVDTGLIEEIQYVHLLRVVCHLRNSKLLVIVQ